VPLADPILLPARNPGPMTGRGNNTWLLDGAEPTLVDAGVGVAEHVDEIAGHLAGRPLVRVLVTHGHRDHASGVPALRSRWPDLDVWKWPGDDETPDALLPLTDGQRLAAGDRELSVIHTPGHAPDHVCFRDELAGAIFTGDMVVRGSTVVIPAGRGGRLTDYLASLEKLAAFRPSRCYPGHGPVIDRPLDLITEYLDHRAMREAQVLDCLAAGLTSVDDMVRRIYPDVTEAIRPFAALTVEAHLEKLREEGRLS
jgi:glyoxylase-like metal-dependent hydrolase (beta-lactamase superfamily II)